MDIHMRFRPRWRAAVTGLVLLASLSACSRVPGIYVYESKQSGTGAGGAAAAFDPTAYVNGIWASKVLPAVQSNAVDVSTVAAAIAADPDAAGKKYGKQAGTGSPYAFLIKGTGTVTKVDTDAPTGPVTVEVPGAAGAKAVTLSIATGPVIAGTALRDAVGFIAFGDFTNQIDYANVANAMNAKVKSDVTGKLDRGALTGKKVTFTGAFSQLAPGQIFMVPTSVEVAP
jgi:predicted lipoprotein